MTSVKRILKSQSGVTLTEVILRSDSAPLTTTYSVRTKRIPEAWSFDNQAAAEECFGKELEQCSKD